MLEGQQPLRASPRLSASDGIGLRHAVKVCHSKLSPFACACFISVLLFLSLPGLFPLIFLLSGSKVLQKKLDVWYASKPEEQIFRW